MSQQPPDETAGMQPAEQQPPALPPQYAQLPYPPAYAAQQPAMGGWIWLGIAIAIVVPVAGSIVFGLIAGSIGSLGLAFVSAPLVLTLVAAIVLTCIRETRRTGIGMWIGIAALPIIGFGVCTALIFGSGY